jgi:methylated-DNA-[protein]-cysteine S-methyltransferase
MILPFLPFQPAEPTPYDIVDSPIGRILLTGDEQALTGLYLLDVGTSDLPRGGLGGSSPRASKASVHPDWVRRPGSFGTASAQLGDYFAGTRTEFDLPLAPHGTPFQLAVWTELARIPYGKTVSYGDVALALGKSLVASRAVGLANGRNPISIILPCHRVIGADGSLTGYGWGLERKEWLLRHEGAAVPASGQEALW